MLCFVLGINSLYVGTKHIRTQEIHGQYCAFNKISGKVNMIDKEKNWGRDSEKERLGGKYKRSIRLTHKHKLNEEQKEVKYVRLQVQI